jgi:Permeases of the major facilitator superfamily
MGYIGSVVLLSFNLWVVLQPGTFGIAEGSTLPARVAFFSVGLWWFGFSLIPFAYLPANLYQKTHRKGLIFQGFRELTGVWRALGKQPFLKGFLGAFFLYSVGLQTVMYMAPTFGAKTIGLSSGRLTFSILIIQLVAIAGAVLFARLSAIVGNIGSLITMVVIWIGVCVGAYFVYDAVGFYILAFGVGLVMGGIQSLSRSTYAKFLPDTQDHASYFSFYDITEKVSIVIGTLSYGMIEQLTGSMRNSVVFLVAFFIGGLVLLVRLSYLDRKVLA